MEEMADFLRVSGYFTQNRYLRAASDTKRNGLPKDYHVFCADTL